MFPTSLAVYRSAFLNSDCSDGIVARPHTEFTKGEKSKKVRVQVNLCIIAPQPNNIRIGVELKVKCCC